MNPPGAPWLADMKWRLPVLLGVSIGLLAGIAGTAVLALIFTLLFLLAGSLWIPMALHSALDLRLLLILEESSTPRPSTTR